MLDLVVLAEAAAGLAGLILLLSAIRHRQREPSFKPMAVTLLLFLLLNMALLVFALSPEWLARLIAMQVAGFVLLALLGAGALATKLLLTEKSARRWMAITIGAALLGFGFVHLKSGLFALLVDARGNWAVVLTWGGKYFFALVIFGCVLFLGKFELLAAAFTWRYGKRGATLAVTLLLLVIAVMAFSSVNLIYGGISKTFLIGCQFICALFFALHAAAMRHGAVGPSEKDAPKIRATQFLSTGALIYGGTYLIAFGLLVKVVTILGGNWGQFVSFFAALSAVVFAFVLITGKSVHRRWTRFVERNLLAGSYDFRRELQNLTAAISAATDRDTLIRSGCRAIIDIFGAKHGCLFVEDEGSGAFRAHGINALGGFAADLAELTLSRKQAGWLERVQQSFAVARLLELNDASEPGEALRYFLATNRYELGAALFAGQKLLGAVFLGPKRSGALYSEEDKQLLDMLGNAVSISLHGSDLQQRILAAKQMESIYRLASFMMHDLRNAVSTLNLLIQNARTHLENKDFRAEFMPALSRVSEEMQALMHKLSSFKTGGEQQHYAECDPAELFYKVLADLPIPQNVALEIDVAPLPRAVWDKDQIRVVLRNLLINALEAMPEGGTLAVRGSHERALIKIAVSDTGVGMSRDFIKHRLFKPNQTTKAKGLGIGLYQSREIVLAHGGNMQVKSRLGEGSTFEILLPCLHENATSQETCDRTRTDGEPERQAVSKLTNPQINAVETSESCSVNHV